MDIFMRKNSFINNTARACDKPIFKKKVLLTENISSYSFPAVAKSTAGRRNPSHWRHDTRLACFFMSLPLRTCL